MEEAPTAAGMQTSGGDCCSWHLHHCPLFTPKPPLAPPHTPAHPLSPCFQPPCLRPPSGTPSQRSNAPRCARTLWHPSCLCSTTALPLSAPSAAPPCLCSTPHSLCLHSYLRSTLYGPSVIVPTLPGTLAPSGTPPAFVLPLCYLCPPPHLRTSSVSLPA